MEEYSLEDFKYLRVGYIPGDREADKLVQHMVQRYPGDGVLPQRWRWISLEYFDANYGHLGKLIWSKTSSFHMMMFNGHHILRFWTDSANTCVVDIHESIARNVSGLAVEEIPESCDRKCKPFVYRTRVSSTDEVDVLLETVNMIWNLEAWRGD